MNTLKRKTPGGFSFRYRLLLGFAMPLTVWVLVSAVYIIGLNNSLRTSDRLVSGQHTLLLANEYLNTLLNAQTGQRGYLITSDPDFLAPYRDAVKRANGIHAELVALSAGQPEHLEHLHRAGNLFQEWIYDASRPLIRAREALPYADVQRAHNLEIQLFALHDDYLNSRADDAATPELLAAMRENIRALERSASSAGDIWRQALAQLDAYEAARVSGAPPPADELRAFTMALTRGIQRIIGADDAIVAAVAGGQGNNLVEEFRQVIGRLIAIEQAFLLEQQAAEIEATERGRLLVWVGPAVGLLLITIVASWMSRRIRRSLDSISAAASGLARGDLRARAEAHGNDEVALLALRFNAMAELVEARSREAAVLAEMGELLQSCRHIDEALRVFEQLAEKMFPDRPGALYLIAPNRDDATAMTFWSGGGKYSKSHFEPEECWALRLGRTHENQSGQAIRCEHLLADGRDSLCVPLQAFGETMGLIFITTSDRPGSILLANGKQNERFISTVTEQLALALANLKLRQTLRNQSIRDPLTQLYNRRYLDETLQRELHRAERHEAPLSVLAFDIDHFKSFNDTYGHDGGDALLRAIGSTLEDFFRTEDLAFRSGGEEFVAVLPGTTLEDALARAEALRLEISSLNVTHGNVLLPKVTISIGVAVYPTHGVNPEELFKAADNALYQAKKNGRNQVVAAEGDVKGEKDEKGQEPEAGEQE